jgi:hypothetical protein
VALAGAIFHPPAAALLRGVSAQAALGEALRDVASESHDTAGDGAAGEERAALQGALETLSQPARSRRKPAGSGGGLQVLLQKEGSHSQVSSLLQKEGDSGIGVLWESRASFLIWWLAFGHTLNLQAKRSRQQGKARHAQIQLSGEMDQKGTLIFHKSAPARTTTR